MSIRPLLIAFGGGFTLLCLVEQFAPRSELGRTAAKLRDAASTILSLQFIRALLLLCGGFFAIAVYAKHTQLQALALNTQDFWLFEDMIRQMREGGFFITRFAPQGLGWIQHGAIHATLSFAVMTLPLSWALGPTWAALVFNPLCLAAAAFFLGLVSRRRWEAVTGWMIAAAFLASNQVGRVLMYDVHPEAAYPLLIAFWFWALMKRSALCVAIAAILGCWVKEDAFLVFFPWFAWILLARKNAAFRKLGAISLIAGAAAYGLQMFAIANFASGAWGAQTWKGLAVTIPSGTGMLAGQHWDSPGSAWAVLTALSAQKGGFFALFEALFAFITSRPWLSLLLLAPWLIRRPAFWLFTLPLAFGYAQLDGPSKLWTYYAAPFLGTIWLAAMLFMPRAKAARWMLGLALVLGGAGIEFHRMGPTEIAAQEQVRAFAPCLRGRGVVSPALIGLVDRERVATDREPQALDGIDFVLLTPQMGRFEMRSDDAQSLIQLLEASGQWRRLGTDCKPSAAPTSPVTLYVKAAR